MDVIRENNQAYCALIDRISTGFVKDLRNTTNNIGMVETSGFEIAATYDWSDKLWKLESFFRNSFPRYI